MELIIIELYKTTKLNYVKKKQKFYNLPYTQYYLYFIKSNESFNDKIQTHPISK